MPRPAPTGPLAGESPTPDPSGSAPPATEEPFTAATWPVAGTACGGEGYRGEMGRIEAPDARTVVFTLCAPDGAFLGKLAHPALGILDAAAIERLAADPGTATSLAGTGPYRIDAWTPGENVRLVLAGDKGAEAAAPDEVPTVILRWAADPLQRTIGAPVGDRGRHRRAGPVGPRPDRDPARADRRPAQRPRDRLPRVRDRVRAGQAGRAPRARREPRPRDARPRRVPGGHDRCHPRRAVRHRGRLWRARVVRVQRARRVRGPRHRRLRPRRRGPARLPGPTRPRPARPARARRRDPRPAHRRTSASTSKLEPLPLSDYQDDLAAGKLEGMYLGGVASSIADPAAFLAPLFGKGVKSTPAARTPDAARAIADAGKTADPNQRAEDFARANEAIRDAASLIPLAHPGSVTAFRTDVTGVVTSPDRPRSARLVQAGRSQAARVHAGDRARRRLLRRRRRAATRTGCAASSRTACTGSSPGR